MAKIIDITDKLSFEEKPVLTIKDKKFTVNDDAPTMLKLMGIMGAEEPTPADIINAYELIFSDKDRKELDKLALSFPDLMIVIKEAMSLVTGKEEAGE